MVTKVSGNLIQTATITGNNIANGTITTNNISTSVNLGGPKISAITYPGDDTAADTAGGQTVVLTGNGFVTGASVLLDGVAVGSATVTNTTSISFTTPAKSTGSYIVYVVNTDGSTAILVPGIQYSGVPSFTTSAGSLGSAYEYAAVSSTIAATGDGTISYSLQSGSLPDGVTLASNGQLSGTTSAQTGNTTFSFTVRATDAQNQDTDRNFSVTINIDAVTWSAPANNATITTYEYAAISNTFVSTSAAGRAVTYSANVLPANVSITGSTVSGTPTTVGNTTSLITSTANTTGRAATQVLNFVVQQDVVTWSSPANNVTYTLDQNVANTTNLAATSAAGQTVTFAANSLPAGLAVSGSTITGTPTTAGNSSSLITATAAVTNRTAVQTINWVIQLAADTYWKNTALLVGGTSDTVSNTFIQDSSTNNAQLTVFGDIKPSNFNPYAEGYYSNYFDGNGDYLTLPSSTNTTMGSGDFTIEFWVHPTAAAGTWTTILSIGVSASVGKEIRISQGQYTYGTLGVLYPNAAGTGDIYTENTGYTLPLNVWTHIAVCRSGSSMYLFADGALKYTYSVSFNQTTTAYVSISNNPWGDLKLTGYMSNVRIVKGTALYTSAFTPPTTPLTAVTNTTVLTCQSSRFIDKSTNNFTITKTGDVVIDPAHPFTPAASSSGSAYFDGSGDYLTLPATSALTLGTGDFTVECWAYFVNYNGTMLDFSTGTAQDVPCFINDGQTIRWRKSNTTITSRDISTLFKTWIHLAVCRVSGYTTLYVNGVGGTAVSDVTNYGIYSTVYIGRTFEGAAQQQGYFSDLRVIKGTAVYTGNFTPPTTRLTAVANTQLLTLQYNGGATNNGFVDQSNFSNPVTRYGNATQGTFSPYSQSGWSNYFGSGSNYISFSTGTVTIGTSTDYTIEAWLYVPALTGDLQMITYNSDNGVGLYLTASNYLYWNKSNVGGGNQSTSAVPLGQWTHIALSRASGTVKFWINGVAAGSWSDSTSFSSTGVSIGTAGGSYLYKGYISNLRMLVGTGLYTTAFTPPTAPLAAIANTVYLTCQSNRFIDNGPRNNAITVTGTVSTQAFSPFGGVTSVPTSYSNYFDGSGDYLSTTNTTAFDFGTGDFTLESWFYPASLSPGGGGASDGSTLISTYSSGTITGYSIAVNSSGYVQFISWVSGNQQTITTTTNPLAINGWYHVAVTRTSGTYKIFVNGVSATFTGTMNQATNTGGNVKIGALVYSTYYNYVTGYISNVRVVKGQALYTSTFTPSTTPLTTTSQGATAANVSLLTCQSATIVDNSPNYLTITANGNTQPTIVNPFGTTSTTGVTYTPSVHGGSMYFDGTGDYVSISNTAGILNARTDNWTIQGWYYWPTAGLSSVAVLAYGTASSGAGRFGIYWASDNYFYVTDIVAVNSIFVNTPMPREQWAHIAVVNNSGTLSFYKNGVLVTTASNGLTSVALTTLYVAAHTGNSWNSNLFFSDVSLTKAALYTANFVPPVAPLLPTTTIGNTRYTSSLLLSGTSGGIIDMHGTINSETVGDVQLAPRSPYAGDTGKSIYFDGTGDYLKYPNTPICILSSGDFTIELWVYPTTSGSYRRLIGWQNGSAGNSNYSYTVDITVGNKAFGQVFDSTTSYNSTSSADVTANQWNHIALVKSGNTLKVYLNGVGATASSTFTTFNAITDGKLYVGLDADGTSYPFTGYIKDLRITKGVARYTSTFTPPTTPMIAK